MDRIRQYDSSSEEEVKVDSMEASIDVVNLSASMDTIEISDGVADEDTVQDTFPAADAVAGAAEAESFEIDCNISGALFSEVSE